MRSKAFKRVLRMALVVLLCMALVPIQAFASDSLRLSGSREASKTEIIINEEFTIEYCVKPEGVFTQRAPINVAFAMDVSGSMNFNVSNKDKRTRLSIAKESAKLITKKFRTANYGDQIGLVTFESHPHHHHNLTTNYNQIDRTIDRLTANGGTNIQMGLDYAYEVVKNADPNNRYIILLTDGAATAYYYYYELFGRTYGPILGQDSRGTTAKRYAMEKADEIARHGVPVFTIALATAGTDEVDLELLDYISTKTGGESFTATNPDELDQAFEKILELIDPSFKDVVLTQPLPDGFELAADNAGAAIKNGVVEIDLGQIAHDSKASKCVPIKFKYTGSPATVKLPEAKVTYKLNGEPRETIIDDEIILKFYDALGLQGKVAASAALSDEELSEWNKNDAAGITYTLNPTGALIRSNNQLRNVKIVHQLPEGVQAVADNSTAGLSVQNEGRTIVIELGNLNIANHQPITRDVKLQFLYAGTFNLAETEAYVEYIDNIGSNKRVPLVNELPVFDVKVILVDQWNNRYIGDGEGVVTRVSHEGDTQWYVDLSENPISSLAFADTGHTSVLVDFAGEEETETLNLLPSAPNVTITDYYGNVIAEGDVEYKRGKGKLAAADANPGLPHNTIYVDDSFTTRYVDRYEYRVDHGPWKAFLPSDTKAITENGENLTIEVRAVTKAIGDGAAVHYGDVKLRTVSLDGVLPIIPALNDSHIRIDGSDLVYTIPNAFSDAHSGIRTDAEGDEVFTVKIGNAAPIERKINADGLVVRIPIEAVMNGQALFEVEDKVGNNKSGVFPMVSDTEKPLIQIVLDPKQTYTKNGTDRTYEAVNGDNTPFDYTTSDNAKLFITVRDDLSDLQSAQYKLDNGAYVDLPINGQVAAAELDLAEILGNDYNGWHRLEVKASDLFGNEATTTYVFMVNTGPAGTPSVEGLDGTSYTGNVSNKPLKVKLDAESVVEGNHNRNAVKIKTVYYMITDNANKPNLDHSEWKEMGSDSIIVSKEGTSYVHFKIVDEMGVESEVITSDRLNINFNQNRY